MEPAELSKTVAYCGLVCGLCPPPRTCECRTNPKPEEATCYQRNCCIGKGLDGCWECDEFPCDQGYYSKDSMWRGLNVASVQCVRDGGKEELVRLILARHGGQHYHGFYMRKTPDQVLRMLRDAPETGFVDGLAGDEGAAPRVAGTRRLGTAPRNWGSWPR